uniref:Uncharacterized protein n=1 Tax=Cacopsylla melanoneura TaxID=428564 RepID=A0A8D8TP44_9HEMI
MALMVAMIITESHKSTLIGKLRCQFIKKEIFYFHFKGLTEYRLFHITSHQTMVQFRRIFSLETQNKYVFELSEHEVQNPISILKRKVFGHCLVLFLSRIYSKNNLALVEFIRIFLRVNVLQISLFL